MIRRCDIRGTRGAGESVDYATLVPRATVDIDAVVERVRPLVEAVRRDGHAELVRQAARFDGVEITRVRVPASALSDALSLLDPEVRRGLEESARRLRSTCEVELPADVVS